MGGYLAALYAARHPEVDRLILLAPAFGFAQRWPESLGAAAMGEWRTKGYRPVFHYGDGRERLLSCDIISDGTRYEEYPDVSQPTLIIHGTGDDVVPPAASVEFANRDPEKRRLILVESGHELTDVLDRLWSETARFLDLPPEE